MRLLERSECEAFVSRVGLDHCALIAGARVGKMKNAACFVYQSRMQEAIAVARCLVDHLGDYTEAMLWAHDLAWGDRSQEERPPEDWRRYGEWRRSAGEGRTLYDAPGHAFSGDERSMLAETIEFAITMGWGALLIARPLRCIAVLSHDDRLAVQSRHNLTALSDKLSQFGLRRRDFEEPRSDAR